MNSEELQRYRSALNMNLGQLDVDYFQHRILLILSRIVSDELVFKGGTALSKVYGLKRFSEDLDFTATREIDLTNMSKKVVSELGIMGNVAELRDIKEDKDSYASKLRIRGNTYDGSEQSRISIRLEISKRERIILDATLAEITPIYNDITPYTILTMKEEEILAEKVRAIFTRNKARDIYDMAFLLNKAVPIKRELIQKKLDHYRTAFSLEKLKEKIHEKEKVWIKELRYLVSSVPEFKDVEKRIIARLRVA